MYRLHLEYLQKKKKKRKKKKRRGNGERATAAAAKESEFHIENSAIMVAQLFYEMF